MQTFDAPSSPNENQVGHTDDSEMWKKLYPLLRTRVARWVCTTRVPSWVRQREEIIEDIVQEVLLRTLVYVQRAERVDVPLIDSLESVSAVIAYHCYVDAFRRDQRLQPLAQDDEEPIEAITWTETDPSEEAIDNIYYELLYIQAAHWIVKFPDKQRTALLTDLANRMYFDPSQPTQLQSALASVGIDMRDYNKPLPSDAMARARHAAHLSLAYKRLALLAYVQRYTLVA